MDAHSKGDHKETKNKNKCRFLSLPMPRTFERQLVFLRIAIHCIEKEKIVVYNFH
jgi:hypothetical protein